MKNNKNFYKTNSHIISQKEIDSTVTTAECGSCRTIYTIPTNLIRFKRFHHHEERFIRYEGYLCPNCGYPIKVEE